MKQKKHYQVWTEISQWTEGKYNAQPSKTNVKTIKAKSKGSAIVKYIETLNPGQTGSIKAKRIRDYKAGVSLKLYDQSGNKVFEVSKQLQDNPTLPKMEPGSLQPTKSNFDKETGVILEDLYNKEWVKANPILINQQVKDAIDTLKEHKPMLKKREPETQKERLIDGEWITIDDYKKKYRPDLFENQIPNENLDIPITITRKQIKNIFERWITVAETNSAKFWVDPKEYHINGPERMTQVFIDYAAELFNWPKEFKDAINKQN